MLKLTRNSVCTQVARRARFFGAAMVLGGVALLAVPSGALAQGGGGGSAPRDSREQVMREMQERPRRELQQRALLRGQPVDAQQNEPRFDLRFNGGTVADYLEAIQEASGKRNIVAMAGTERVPMPPVALDNVNTQAAVSVLINMIAEMEADVFAGVDVNTRADVVTVSVEFARPRSGPFGPAAPPQRGTAVHGLAGLLSEEVYTVDAILSAIEVALEMAGDSEAVLRYHEETRMLFVYGTGEEHDTVRNVLEELELQVHILPNRAMSSTDGTKFMIEDIERGIQAMERELRAWESEGLRRVEQEIDMLRVEILELEQQMMDGESRPMSEEELAMKYRALERAMMEKEEIETRMRNARVERESLMARRAELQAELERSGQP